MPKTAELTHAPNGWTVDGRLYWMPAGATAADAIAESDAPPDELSQEEIVAGLIDRMSAMIDARVEAQARALRYNSSAHIASYVASTVPQWAAEAAAFVAWRDAVWLAALAMLLAANETGVVPAHEEVLAGLPAWPGVPE